MNYQRRDSALSTLPARELAEAKATGKIYKALLRRLALEVYQK